VERAVEHTLAVAGKRFPCNIHLAKHIPIGAGMGGGSADAAFAIKTINTLADCNFNDQEMEQLAAHIGSDCPFFVQNKPKFVTGRGEIMEDFKNVLAGKYIVLIYPKIHISTKEAYAGILPKKPASDLKEILNSPIENWKTNLINDFEFPIVKKYPEIGEIKEELYLQGAAYASMTGSGSAVFGIFEKPQKVNKNFSNHFFWTGKLA